VTKLQDNFRFLRSQTGVHIHADLIAGLPGETFESFAAGFDRLVGLQPQEIQVGILKRLRGTPIVRHDAEWQMCYGSHPPYEILANKLLDFATLQRLRRFAKYWDMVGNSGNFVETTPLLWRDQASPFQRFMQFSDWLFVKVGRTDSIALARLAELMFLFLTEELGAEKQLTAETLWRDYQRGGRREKPEFLRPYIDEPVRKDNASQRAGLRRQTRHLAT
jgi:Protein of unknown function (DUF4080)